MLNHQLSQAQSILRNGGVIAYSTETVLGLGCDPRNQSAVNRLCWLKNRALENGLIVVVSNLNVLQQFSQPLTQKHVDTISTTEKITWLLPANDTVPNWITGKHEKVAVRISEHPIAGPLSTATDGIVSTSANISSYKTLTSQSEIRDWFGPHVDYMLIECAGSGSPSQICDLLSGKVLRSN